MDIDDGLPEWLMILFAVNTVSLIACNLFALLTSGMHSEARCAVLGHCVLESKHRLKTCFQRTVSQGSCLS